MGDKLQNEQRNARAVARKTLNDQLVRSGVSKAYLAREMDVTRASLTGFFKSDRNITFNSLATMLYHMGYRITGLSVERIREEEEEQDS